MPISGATARVRKARGRERLSSITDDVVMKRTFSQPAGKQTVPKATGFEGAVAPESAGQRANGRPTRARAEEIQSAILAAGLAEFAERGFHGGSIVRIAE